MDGATMEQVNCGRLIIATRLPACHQSIESNNVNYERLHIPLLSVTVWWMAGEAATASDLHQRNSTVLVLIY